MLWLVISELRQWRDIEANLGMPTASIRSLDALSTIANPTVTPTESVTSSQSPQRMAPTVNHASMTAAASDGTFMTNLHP